MLDAKILAAVISSRAAYDRVSKHLTDKDLSPPVQFWWAIVQEWYERDKQATSVDPALLAESGKTRIKNPKHYETIMGVLVGLEPVASADNVASVALELKRHNVGLALAAAIAGQKSETIAELLPAYQELWAATSLTESSQWEDARDWHELDEVVGAQNRVFVAPRKLNDKLSGGALPGHHIVVFGRPDAGKSTVAINMSAGFLHYGQRVLYVGNEDNINVLKSRVRNRLSEMTPDEVAADPAKANKRAADWAQDRLMMRHLHRGQPADLEKAIEEFEPTILIVDQIRNLEAKGDSLTQKLERNAVEIRRLLSTYALIGVSVTQAYPGDHNRPHKVWLDMDDIESSRTGLPGQADLIVGIAGSAEMFQRNQRTLSLSKNKLSSDPNAHEGVIVEIDKAKAKVW